MLSNLLKFIPVFVFLLVGGGAFAEPCLRDSGDVVVIEDGGQVYHAQVVANYIAHIGARDLRNSSGVRLTNYAAILQQDRANLHKTGRNDGDGAFADGWDDHFITLQRRSEISTARFVTDCWMSPRDTQALKDAIEDGQPIGLWVLAFYQPNGGLALYISGVN